MTRFMTSCQEHREQTEQEIARLLKEIHEESHRPQRPDAKSLARTMALFSSLLGVLSIQADIQTRRIVRLTWTLVVLTFALLFFTVYLSQEAYFENKRVDQTYKHASEKQKSDAHLAHDKLPP